MPSVSEVQKQLQTLAKEATLDEAVLMDALKALEAMSITLDVLQTTKIGRTVNTVRKKAHGEAVCALAKTLIARWKKLVPANQHAGLSRTSSASSNGSSQPLPVKPKRRVSDSANVVVPDFKECGDVVRDKSRRLLAKTLMPPKAQALATDKAPGELAVAIETTIFGVFRCTNDKYQAHMRSRVFNLKNPMSSKRIELLSGALTPEQFATMTAEALQSEAQRQVKAKAIREALDEKQLSFAGGTQTNTLQCGRCRKKNATYTQMQTRSADEPMTTFVVCNECGHRWKFC